MLRELETEELSCVVGGSEGGSNAGGDVGSSDAGIAEANGVDASMAASSGLTLSQVGNLIGVGVAFGVAITATTLSGGLLALAGALGIGVSQLGTFADGKTGAGAGGYVPGEFGSGF